MNRNMKLFLQCLIRLDQCSKQVTNPMVILMKLTSFFFFGKDKKKIQVTLLKYIGLPASSLIFQFI